MACQVEKLTFRGYEMKRISPLDLRSLMLRKGVKQAQIAKDLDVSNTAVNFIVEGKSRSARIELAIAVALNQSVETLFPEKEVKG